MSIRQFRAILAISEQGSFAAAARELNLTQSAIGMQVAALEQSLGVKLFDRNFRPPRLTRAGTVATNRARTIVAQYDDLVDSLSEPDILRGSFRLGVIPTVLTNLLPATLMRLRDEEPGLTVNVSSNLSGELMQQVERRDLDAALMHKPDEVGSAFTWSDITRQRVVIVAPPDATDMPLADLFARYTYIRFNRSAWIAPLIEARLAELQLSPRTGAEISTIEAIHLLVALGFGLSILPDVGSSSGRGLTGSGRGLAGLGNPSPQLLDFGDPPIHRTIGLLSRRDMSKKNARRSIERSFIEEGGPG